MMEDLGSMQGAEGFGIQVLLELLVGRVQAQP